MIAAPSPGTGCGSAEKSHRWLSSGLLDRAAAVLSNRAKTAIQAARGNAGAGASKCRKKCLEKYRDRGERCGRNARRGCGYVSEAAGAQREALSRPPGHSPQGPRHLARLVVGPGARDRKSVV